VTGGGGGGEAWGKRSGTPDSNGVPFRFFSMGLSALPRYHRRLHSSFVTVPSLLEAV